MAFSRFWFLEGDSGLNGGFLSSWVPFSGNKPTYGFVFLQKAKIGCSLGYSRGFDPLPMTLGTPASFLAMVGSGQVDLRKKKKHPRICQRKKQKDSTTSTTGTHHRNARPAHPLALNVPRGHLGWTLNR